MKFIYRWSGAFEAAGLGLVVLAASLLVRPLYPVDETRYLSVAWEMWQQGDFMVPRLNGHLYSHKPPLLFWLIHGGWALFGVNEWSARVVAPLFGVGTLFLSARLAREFWPQEPMAARNAPLLLVGTGFWCGYSTLTMFDMLLAFVTVLALLGVVLAGRGVYWRGWILCGIGIGFGVLSKGPAVLVHILPAVLSAPLWLKQPRGKRWLHWYGGLAFSLALGTVIGLCWALPAAWAGGPEFADAIFWGQTAGRVVNAFDHALPPWWYLIYLPLLLLPWVIWTPLWRGLRRLEVDSGVRFCLAWALGSLIIFSLISGKRLHYLIPILPAFALLVVRGLGKVDALAVGRGHKFLAPMLIVVGAALTMIDHWDPVIKVADWMQTVSPLWGCLVAVLGVGLWLWHPANAHSAIRGIAVATATFSILVQTGFFSATADRFDLKRFSQRLAALQKSGTELMFDGKYHGEYHFLGRLEKPIPETKGGISLSEWVEKTPDGVAVVNFSDPTKIPGSLLVCMQPYRGKYVALVRADVLAAHPEIVRWI